MQTQKPSRLLLILAFFAIYFVWGTTYLANLFALESIKPFVLSCLRYMVAGLLLAGWVQFKKISWPDVQTIKVLSISGIIMLVGGSGLVVYAEQYINSGYAAAVVATEPLWFVVLDKKRWKLYFSNPGIIAGLLLGFTGIVLFSHFAPENHTETHEAVSQLTGTLIVLASALLWVLGTLYANSKMKPGSSNMVNSAVQLLAAGMFSGILALCLGEWHAFSPHNVSGKALGGLLFLIVMGSLVAYMAFMWLVTVRPPAIVSTHTYVNPVIAILLGWLLAGEEIVLNQVIALLLVLAGILFTQVSKERNFKKEKLKFNG